MVDHSGSTRLPATRVVRVTRHAENHPNSGQRRLRRIRRLLVLVTMIVGIWWVVQQLVSVQGRAVRVRDAYGPVTVVVGGLED